jgi:hypothetical protein
MIADKNYFSPVSQEEEEETPEEEESEGTEWSEEAE